MSLQALDLITLDDIRAMRSNLAALADQVERLTTALRELAAYFGAELNGLGRLSVVDVFDRDDLAERVATAGDDPEAVARG